MALYEEGGLTTNKLTITRVVQGALPTKTNKVIVPVGWTGPLLIACFVHLRAGFSTVRVFGLMGLQSQRKGVGEGWPCVARGASNAEVSEDP